MTRLFQKVRRDVRGAVTVFVTLLLIPALLITGTGVDIARIYAARSVIHDANQLAANSALASYNALLHDLYGLFGMMTEEEGFKSSLQDYVNYSIFPKDGRKDLGTFQLFYGSAPKSVDFNPATNKHLANAPVLRRQIEDYSKFRAPVIIVSEILQRLDTFQEVQEDAEIINDKMEIEEDLEDLEKVYRQIYELILKADEGKSYISGFLNIVNARIQDIKGEFTRLYDTRSDYYKALDAETSVPKLDKNGSYTSKEDVSLYIRQYGDLPQNFITKDDARTLGWEGGSLEPYAPGKSIGGDSFGNREGKLRSGYTYYECDIDTMGKDARGAKRIVFTKGGELVYYTEDHYQTFALLYDGFDENSASEDYLNKYRQSLENIRAYVNGGNVSDYMIGGEQNGRYIMGYRTNTREIKKVESAAYQVSEANSILKEYRETINNLVEKCREGDRKKEKLKQKVNELRQKLETAHCDEGLKEGVREKVAEYEALLRYDLENMAADMQRMDNPILTKLMAMANDDQIGYGRYDLGTGGTTKYYTFTTLASLTDNSIFSIDQGRNASGAPNYLTEIDAVTPHIYTSPGTYLKFEEVSTKNREFFQYLSELFSGDKDGSKKKKVKKNVADAMGQVQEQFKKLLEFDPEGAYKYTKSADEETSESTDFGQEGKWSKEGEAEKNVRKSLDSSLVKALGAGLDDAADKLLLLTYASEMFSCYSTNQRSDEKNEKSMSGIPFGVKVNYFYQSELEYIYHGNGTDAIANLAAVTGMIFLIRFVMDYIVSFGIPQVNNTVTAVEEALAGTGPFAVVAGELVRVAMALGEGVMDVGRLKKGDMVALLKNEDNWTFSLSGLTETLSKVSFDDDGSARNQDDDGVILSYKDYMRLFLLLTNGDTIARRVSQLIALNVTNYRDGIGGKESRNERENAMTNATLFRMDKAVTDFSITTTIDLKMLFLSMPFARRGANGVIPPGTLELKTTDYRGY